MRLILSDITTMGVLVSSLSGAAVEETKIISYQRTPVSLPALALRECFTEEKI